MFQSAIFRKIISFLAILTPKILLILMIGFWLGVLSTISIAKITNVNLASIGTPDIDSYSYKCLSAGIAGQVLDSDSNAVYGAEIITSPPTDTIKSDGTGYFAICDIAVGEVGHQYTITATARKGSSPTSCAYKGTTEITVFPQKTSRAIIQAPYDCP